MTANNNKFKLVASRNTAFTGHVLMVLSNFKNMITGGSLIYIQKFSMKKLLSIIVITALLFTNPLKAQTKEKTLPTKNQTSSQDSVVVGFNLKIDTKEYMTLQGLLSFLLKTELPVQTYIEFQTIVQKLKPIIEPKQKTK